MATIIRRTGKNGQLSFHAQVRRQGAPPPSATCTKLSEARKWVQVTEAAIVEGRHFKVVEAQRHTLADLTDCYIADILPTKSASSIRKQTQQLLCSRTLPGALPSLSSFPSRETITEDPRFCI